MRYIFSLGLIIFCALQSIAQEKHFILIQSENKQLFNATLNGKVYSTNSSGYVIIPKVLDGEYSIVIGFAENNFPDQVFKCVVDKKDAGFTLQNFGEKGWALFNLQTLAVTTATVGSAASQTTASQPAAKAEDEPISFNRKDNPVAAKPVDTVVQKPVVKTEEVISAISDTTTLNVNVNKGDEVSAAKDSVVEIHAAKDSGVVISSTSAITKMTEYKTNEVVTMLYSDPNGAKIDTIQVTIPLSNDSDLTKNDTAKTFAEDSVVAARIEQLNSRKDDVKFIEIDMNVHAADSAKNNAGSEIKTAAKNIDTTTDKSVERDIVKVEKTEPIEAKVLAVDTVSESKPVPAKLSTELCKNVANEEDYSKLRRKMSLENSDEKMIREAKKIFKEKCFTTHQVRGLSTLFLSDEGRFHFFTAAFSFVSDPATYPSLQSEFIDPFYINRFKSIVQ